MDELMEVMTSNSLDDVTWLCSLSESELDLLISLKKLVVQRAKLIGHEVLSHKFDLKMLRALGLILMENLKQKLEDKSLVSSSNSGISVMDVSNLLKGELENILSEEEIRECICHVSRKRRRAKRRQIEEADRNPRRLKCDNMEIDVVETEKGSNLNSLV